MQGTWVWFLVWEDSTCCNYGISYAYRAHDPQQKKTPQWEASTPQQSSPYSPPLDKAQVQQQWPSTAKNKIKKWIKCWERLKAKGEGNGRGWDSITNSTAMNLSKLWETVEEKGPGMLQSMRSQRVRHDINSATTKCFKKLSNFFLKKEEYSSSTACSICYNLTQMRSQVVTYWYILFTDLAKEQILSVGSA